jgi:hypothetical protein
MMKLFRLCIETTEDDGGEMRQDPIGHDVFCEILEKRNDDSHRKHQYYSECPFVVVITITPNGCQNWERSVSTMMCDEVLPGTLEFTQTADMIAYLKGKVPPCDGHMEQIDVTDSKIIHDKIKAAFEKFKELVQHKPVDLSDLTKFPPPSIN